MPGDRAAGGFLCLTRRVREQLIVEIDGKFLCIWITKIRGKQAILSFAGDGFKVTRAEIFNERKAEVGNGAKA